MTMRYLSSAFVILSCLCVSAVPQSPGADDQLMAKARAAYDAPFTRNLAAFDCSVQFEWKQHFTEMFGNLPPAAEPIAEKTSDHYPQSERGSYACSCLLDPKAAGF